MSFDSTYDTQTHIAQVRTLMFSAITNLLQRSIEHDLSKLEDPEKGMFDLFTPKLRGLTYGSDEYKKTLAEMGPALEHHYAHNSHHPEHLGYAECDICFTRHPRDFEGHCSQCQHGTFTLRPNIEGMSLFDLLEMLCDWKAAGMRHADGDFAKSLEYNRKHFNIPEVIYAQLIYTAQELKWI